MALTIAQNDWIDAKSRNDIVGVMAFDLSAAFDTLEHSKLLDKLETAGISGVPLKWFKSYLQGRSQSVLWNNIMSESRQIDRGVPQGSILGPILFLVMIYDMPKCLTKDTLNTSSRVTGYADDTAVYVKVKHVNHLKPELERLASEMICYCNDNGLILNGQKTQILTSIKDQIEVKIGKESVLSSPTISLLGLEYDSNFSTVPYLRQLAREASARSALIKRLSYGMPNCLLKPISNGILMGKILAAAPAAIPIRLNPNDKPYLSGILNDIDKSIRATARTITHTKLTDKLKSELVLHKAGLRGLTEAVIEIMACAIWKARREMNPLGRIFQNKVSTRNTRSTSHDNLCQPVPGHPQSAANKLAQIWNNLNLSSAKTLGCVRTSAQRWYRENVKYLS